MSSWVELPAESDIQFKSGNFYAIVASVGAGHSESDIKTQAAARGLTIFDYAEQGQRAGLGPDPKSPDYRYVAVQAQATRDGKLPWSPGFPASLVAKYSVVKAWEAAPGEVAPPVRPASGGDGLPTWPFFLAGAGLLWWLWKKT